MRKTILIPTDFSINSLGLVRIALEENLDVKLNLILAHGVHLGTDISDLLFFSRKKLLKPLLSEEFEAAFQMLRSKYESQIHNYSIEIFTGVNQNAFTNFIEGNGIMEAYVPIDYTPLFKNRNSFDLAPYIKKSGIGIHEIAFEPVITSEYYLKQDSLADLFFTRSWPSLNNNQS